MAKQGKRSGLGRGLSSLIGEGADQDRAVPANEVSAATYPAETGESSSTVEGGMPRSAGVSPADNQSAGDALDHKVRPYVEEDDHVEIHGVVERAARAGDELPLDRIVPNPDQPRTQFKPEEIEELANSIEKEGLLQPIVVRKVGDAYQIVAGERRWQACRSLGLAHVPVRIVDATDEKAIELALIENIQRADLNPIEEAYGYKRLMERRGMTQSEVAAVVSKGRSTIANALRLLDLPESAQQLLYEEKITAGHARAILSIPTQAGRQKLTEKLLAENLSVREAEAIARLLAAQGTASAAPATRAPLPAAYKKVAQTLRNKLQTNVRIRTVRGKNKVEIEFGDEDDLKRLFSQLIGEE